jgi:hypothetical protein
VAGRDSQVIGGVWRIRTLRSRGDVVPVGAGSQRSARPRPAAPLAGAGGGAAPVVTAHVDTTAEPEEPSGAATTRTSALLSLEKACAVVGILGPLVGPAVFGVDVGVSALATGAVLLLMRPALRGPGDRPWATVRSTREQASC